MNIPIITVTSDPSRATRLIASARRLNWDLRLLHVEWQGFGTKIIETYNYLKKHPEITEFVFCDAHDVVVLGTEEEFKLKLHKNTGPVGIMLNLPSGFVNQKFVFSAEKGCWPIPQLEPHYPVSRGSFKFLNSGCYYAKSKEFCTLVSKISIKHDHDDQLYFTIPFLKRDRAIALDYHQTIFNSHSFIDSSEYTYENGRVQFYVYEPVFIHSNGGTIDPKLEELLKQLGI